MNDAEKLSIRGALTAGLSEAVRQAAPQPGGGIRHVHTSLQSEATVCPLTGELCVAVLVVVKVQPFKQAVPAPSEN